MEKDLNVDTGVIVQSKCFICSKTFNAKLLAEHEKTCLVHLQDDLTCITKEIDTLLDVESESVKSATSSGSSENNRKSVRCYICGEEFASHYISIHERQCKRKWDAGVTQENSLRKGASLGHIPAVREVERGKQKDNFKNESMRKAQSVANITQHGPKQAWNARMRHKESKEALAKENGKKRPVKKERPKSAYVKSVSTQNLDRGIFSAKEFGIYDDSMENERGLGVNEKAVSMQDLSPSNVARREEFKAAGPKFIECQYCFKMFSIHSIYIHEKKCLCRSHTEKAALVRPKRKPRANGRCVSVNELRFANGEDDWLIDNQPTSSLAISSENVSSPKVVGNGESPRFLLCSYCTKPFGSKSLPIHLPQCQRKYEREHREKRRNDKHATDISVIEGARNKTPLRQTASSPASSINPAQWSGESPTSTAKNKLQNSPRSSAIPATSASSTAGRNPPSMKNRITPKGRRPPTSNSRSASSASASAYIACQFCNNYYGSASVKIHENKCLANQKNQEAAKSKERPARKQLGKLFGVQR